MKYRTEPYKILGMTDSPLLPTGYANQSREIFTRLAQKEHFDCSFLGWSYHGQPMHVNHKNSQLSSNVNGRPKGTYKLLPCGNHAWGGPDNPFDPRSSILMRHLNDERPDLLWVLCDSFMITYLQNWDLAPTKFLFYYPSDGWPLPEGTRQLFEKANYLVGMSKYAQKEVIDEIGRSDVHYIPHGVDSKKFYPVTPQEKMALRDKWSRRFGFNLQGKFIVGTVARNQGRKMTHELCKAFADFAKDKDDVVLLLHCDPNDPASGGTTLYNLLQNRLGCAGKFFFTGMSWMYGFSDHEMHELYGMMDVHALSTSGEGFGIPTVEAMACGVPSVLTDFTNTRELVGDNNERGLAIPKTTTITGTYNVERAIIDKVAMTEGFNKLYYDRKLLQSMGEKCVPFFRENFEFDSVVFPMWEQYLMDVVLK